MTGTTSQPHPQQWPFRSDEPAPSPRRTRGNRQSIPTSVCFFEQNPLSLCYLKRLLRGPEFLVISEKEAYERQCPPAKGQPILVFDDKILTLQCRPPKRSLRDRFPEARLLVLGAQPLRGEDCQRLPGIDGFVLYAEVNKKLVPALRALRDGQLWLPPEVIEYYARLAVHGFRPESKNKAALTSREEEVIRLVTEGLSNKEIGNNLGITERTVKFHVGNVLAKLGVQDRHSAAKMARSLLVSESGDCPRRYLPVPSS